MSTSNYQLNQWEKTDRIMMEDFNADNAKLEQALTALALGNCRIEHGTYTGTGTYGAEKPCSITFSASPLVVLISSYNLGQMALMSRGSILCPCLSVNNKTITPIYPGWTEGNTFTWYSYNNVEEQLNYYGNSYHYFALLAVDEA